MVSPLYHQFVKDFTEQVPDRKFNMVDWARARSPKDPSRTTTISIDDIRSIGFTVGLKQFQCACTTGWAAAWYGERNLCDDINWDDIPVIFQVPTLLWESITLRSQWCDMLGDEYTGLYNNLTKQQMVAILNFIPTIPTKLSIPSRIVRMRRFILELLPTPEVDT